LGKIAENCDHNIDPCFPPGRKTFPKCISDAPQHLLRTVRAVAALHDGHRELAGQEDVEGDLVSGAEELAQEVRLQRAAQESIFMKLNFRPKSFWSIIFTKTF
jgi:hypothetical protein